MDRVTQLEDAYDTLLKVMAAATAFLSRKAHHVQVNPSVPLTVLGNTEAASDEVLSSSRQELVNDLVAQAKEVQWRIDQLPSDELHPESDERLAALNGQLHEANEEYRAALEEARTLASQLDRVVQRLCDEQLASRRVLES